MGGIMQTKQLLNRLFLGVVALGWSVAVLAGSEDYSGYPEKEWPTFGGDYANTRFSKLEQINRGNVYLLKPAWSFSTNLPFDPVHNFMTVPVVIDGVMYLTDPGNFLVRSQNVFAVNAETGVQFWHKQLQIDRDPFELGQFNIRTNRGVGVGNGRVFVATQDARLWALDARTGNPIDSFGVHGNVQVGDVFAGHYLTAAPIFVPRSKVPSGGRASGRDLVLIGIAGSENEVRGYFSAYDARSGELLWRFFTVPSPGEFGSKTWPTITSGPFANPFTRGGAAPWMPPAYDSEMGLVIFGTGNAGIDYDGTHRAGDNLFSSSIVALDVRNGRRVWHYQTVHHDVWDYDQASAPVLFDVNRHGKPVKAVGAAGKTGWFYILDRKTGKPLIPCPERSVPVATTVVAPDGTPEILSRTQPHCESDAFVPQGGRRLPNGQYIHPIFTPPGPPTPGSTGPYLFPFWVELGILPMVPVNDALIEPGNLGGADWTPTSFNPNLGLAYIGGNVWPVRMTAFPTVAPTGTGNLGGWWSFTAEEQVATTGTLTAMDVSTGKIRWQVKTEAPAYGGTCATAGNLVFLGELADDPSNPFGLRSYFSAYDARTGEQVLRYSMPNGDPIAAPCVTYSVRGRQYVAVSAGGGAFFSTKGNSIHVFALPRD
jgi:PQQ-dependent dehydrogenase (methanol/ethanol family)